MHASKCSQASLWFVRSGHVNPGDKLYYAGERGYSWSSRSGSSNTTSAPHTDRAYHLWFSNGATNLDPSSNGNRYAGFPLRCIVYVIFIRSGLVNPYYISSDEQFRWAGKEGYSWSSRATSYASSTDAKAHYLGFYDSSLNPSENYHRYIGIPLRCIVDI